MDTTLIKTVNKLQDAFATAGVHNPVDLPQITVIGSQSSGKSSVLWYCHSPAFEEKETTTAGDNKDNDSSAGSLTGDDNQDEWDEFLHLPGQKFYKFDEIRDEIVCDTELKTGKNLGISPQPITCVPVGDQPKEIEKQIREMLLKYNTKPNAIILAVTASNTDFANSDGLKMAREVDPEGLRTIGVLTKIDLMDEETDVIDILAGRVIPLRLGYVPVVNRGQRDIDSKKRISKALKAEHQFFENHQSYKSKTQYCGTPFLILMHHIRTTLPEIKSKIQVALTNYQQELIQLGDQLGEGEGGRANLVLNIITEFWTIIDGNSNDLSSFELYGGARISFVFHELYSNGVKSIDPLEQTKDSDIRTILYNSSGSSPALFVATTAFKVIIKQQIKRLEDLSIKCINMVYDELVRILGQLLTKQFFKRFLQMKDKMESCYINIAHPDFLNGHQAIAIVNEQQLQTKYQSSGTEHGKLSSRNQAHHSPSLSTSDANQHLISPSSDNGSFFGSFFVGNKKNKRSGSALMVSSVLDTPPASLKATGTLSDRGHMETKYNIVKRTMIYMVPKAIMLNFVSRAKEELQRELLAELYKADVLDKLLQESDFTQQRRKECQKMIQASTSKGR
ncbi:Dynamin central region-domain-containing protein [Chlamydoabsidia padenii]|nr:Dynamin central region-domain-containing protein [Chlamydoabsidia padenii]